MEIIKSKSGSITPLALFLTLALALGYLAMIQLFHQYRSQSEKALRLDFCTGKIATQLSSLQNRIESLNSIIKKTRLSIVALAVSPGTQSSLPTLKSLLVTLSTTQELLLKAWPAQARLIILGSSCKKDISYLNLKLPQPSWIKELPDLIGPKPLLWPPGLKRELKIKLVSKNFLSLGRKEKSGTKVSDQNETGKWSAQWFWPND